MFREWNQREIENILGAVKRAKIDQNRNIIKGIAKKGGYGEGYLDGCQDVLDILARAFGISQK